MNIKSFSLSVAAFVICVPLTTLAGSMNVKPGAWEMTSTALTSGMSMPADTLSQMSPEQRAMMEKAMQRFAGKPRTIVTKNCVTKEDLDEDRVFKEVKERNCTTKVISRSANRMVFEIDCGAPNPSKATMITEAKTPESLSGTMDMVQGSGGKVHVDVKGRWLGASCEGIKRID